jgi:hypothetical protein
MHSSNCQDIAWFDTNKLRLIIKAIKKIDGAVLKITTQQGDTHQLEYDLEYKTWNITHFMKLGGGEMHDQKRKLNRYLNTIDNISHISIYHRCSRL